MTVPIMSTDMKSSPLALSEEDVQRLLRDTSSETRVDMADRIAGAYGHERLAGHEVMVAEQIFRLLLRDTEVRVRVALAENVKNSPAIPHDIVKSLAKDVEEVSLPVLQFSEVLTDEDLVEIIKSSESVSRQLAISSRKVVSMKVSDTLLDKGNEKVAAALAGNIGAVLSDSGVDKIIKTHGNNESVMRSLSTRSGLPAGAVNKLVNVVSGALAETLKKKYAISAEQIDREVEKTREKETLELIRHTHGKHEVGKIVSQLRAFNALTPSIILGGLCQGNMIFFEVSLSSLAGVPLENTQALIHDKGELGFRAIYNKSGLPDAMFPAVNTLIKIVHELKEEGERSGTPQFANRVVERILQQSEAGQTENLSYIIALVRKAAQIHPK
ncbi:MAG: DUF2336 domain-containing protein [Alphaproteobacteria bacterium]